VPPLTEIIDMRNHQQRTASPVTDLLTLPVLIPMAIMIAMILLMISRYLFW